MSLKKALLAATMLSLPLAANAQQPISGVYLGAGAGYNYLQSTSVDLPENGPNILGAADIDFDHGWGGVVSVGYGFGNGLRAELEGNYRENEVDKIGSFPGIGGKARTYGAMVNALYDFNLGLPVVPYVGAGVGWVWHDYDTVRSRFTPNNAGVNSLTINDTDNSFAFQGIVGAAFPIAAVPGLAITAEYRFLGSLQPEMTAVNRSPTGVAVSRKVDVDNYNHSAFLGIRYAFNQAPPPAPVPVAPAPAAAPAPARTYLVFFDFDRADLTDRARQIIAEAAQNSGRVQATRIEVAGHADRSGTPQYNQRLSQRRADAVAAELTRLGVARSAITVQAFGESRPLVPTADGVREPQNRRVEIVLR
ncbi:OmpA family protein [Pseudoroseomonas globiformis]|uniref:OmpA family protein n=1 Tax=Teichococcus globiformis TaxID=2307229 RepID=A0ABV7FYW0_9PROT